MLIVKLTDSSCDTFFQACTKRIQFSDVYGEGVDKT